MLAPDSETTLYGMITGVLGTTINDANDYSDVQISNEMYYGFSKMYSDYCEHLSGGDESALIDFFDEQLDYFADPDELAYICKCIADR